MRVDISYPRQILRHTLPILAHFYPAPSANLFLLCGSGAQVCLYRIQYRGRVGILHSFLMAKPPRPVYDDPFVVISRYLVYHNGINERHRLGLNIRSSTAPFYLYTVLS